MQEESKKRSIEFVQIEFIDIEEDLSYSKIIEKVIQEAFKEENLEELNLCVNIILTTPNNIRQINKKYRNIDKETDVLSFPMFQKEEINLMKENGNDILDILGDIVISIDRVKNQAQEYGHSFERELSYMVVHGFYHLMGYDHIEENQKKDMREKEEKLLNNLNIKR